VLEQSAKVVEVRDDTLWVESDARGGCSQCSSGSCATSVVSKLFGSRRSRFQLENTLGAKDGEQVVVGIPDELLVRASVWAYLLPLVVMVALAALGSAWGMSEGMQSLMALLGLAGGFLLVRRATRSVSSQQRFKPKLLRIAGHGQLQVELLDLTRS
jgi:sigma-E factor negative regulatory protein RseC